MQDGSIFSSVLADPKWNFKKEKLRTKTYNWDAEACSEKKVSVEVPVGESPQLRQCP